MADPAPFLFTFKHKANVPEDVGGMLVPGETAVAAYKTIRDHAIFTDRRLIIRDSQGVTGKKVEIYSVPWKSVEMWSSENAGGVFDRDTELEMWTRVGHMKVNLKRGIDIRELDTLIARCVLGS